MVHPRAKGVRRPGCCSVFVQALRQRGRCPFRTSLAGRCWIERQEAEKTQRQERLRKENGVPARGLEEAMYAEVKAFASRAEYEDKTRVRQEWPALATWYRQGIKEQWELENVTSELRDYGVPEWKNRVLEVGFVAITFKMKH